MHGNDWRLWSLNPEEEMIELINMLGTVELLSLILLISMVVMPTKFSSAGR